MIKTLIILLIFATSAFASPYGALLPTTTPQATDKILIYRQVGGVDQTVTAGGLETFIQTPYASPGGPSINATNVTSGILPDARQYGVYNLESYGTPQAAITAIGSNPVYLRISTAITLTTSIAFPSNIILCPQPGAMITTTGYTLSFASQPFAGLFQWLTGSGNLIFPVGGTDYPEWFGAKGNATTDDAVACDTAVYALSGNGGTTYLTHTYLLGTFSARPGGSSSFIVASSNVNIFGQGPPTGFLVKAGLSPSAWNVIYSTSLVQNAIYQNFQISGNTNLGGNQPNTFIGSTAGGQNILIDNIIFTNNPGNDTVAFGGTTASTLGKIRVQNCQFLGAGSGITGNTNTDHSDIYLVGFYNKVLNNYASSTNHVTGAFCEFHGDYGECAGNKVYGYSVCVWIAKNVSEGNTNLTETYMHDNSFINVYEVGFNYANDTTAGTFGRTHVYNNEFIIGSGASAAGTTIAFSGPYSGSATMILDESDVHDNVFINNDSSTINLYQPLQTKDVRFRNNKAYNFARGIEPPSGTGIDGTYSNYNIEIQNNLFDNFNDYAVYTPGGTVKTLKVTGNTMNTGTSGCMSFTGTASAGYVGDNLLNTSGTYPMNFGSGMSAVQIDQMDPYGKRYVRYNSANVVYGLNYVMYATSTPSFVGSPGDIVYNSAPSHGSPMGWVCTAFGAPGTWYPMPNL